MTNDGVASRTFSGSKHMEKIRHGNYDGNYDEHQQFLVTMHTYWKKVDNLVCKK